MGIKRYSVSIYGDVIDSSEFTRFVEMLKPDSYVIKADPITKFINNLSPTNELCPGKNIATMIVSEEQYFEVKLKYPDVIVDMFSIMDEHIQ